MEKRIDIEWQPWRVSLDMLQFSELKLSKSVSDANRELQ